MTKGWRVIQAKTGRRVRQGASRQWALDLAKYLSTGALDWPRGVYYAQDADAPTTFVIFKDGKRMRKKR